MLNQVEFRVKNRLMPLSFPLVMGILNVTPDSFYSDSRANSIDKAWYKANEMWTQGAGIIDIGGASSRPGAIPPSINEEIDRIIPVIEYIASQNPDIIMSVDTYRSAVASAAIQAGAHIINDISSGSMDPDMIDTVAKSSVPYIAMHMQGTPQTMQEDPKYDNITLNVLDYFFELIHELNSKGIYDIIIDPGFGFGKSLMHNYELLYKLHAFQTLNCPILAGVSRKSMIYKLLDKTPDQALAGTTALHWEILNQGAQILRVHDVVEAVDVIRIFEHTKHLNPRIIDPLSYSLD